MRKHRSIPPSTLRKATELQLTKRLGKGSFGDVWLAILDNKSVAVKCPLAKNDVELRKIRRETYFMTHITSPYTIGSSGLRGHEFDTYTVMEYCSGGTLKDLLPKACEHSDIKKMTIAMQIAYGLSHIHAAGVIHCDIKPDNILFTCDGTVKITDFGLSINHQDVAKLTDQERAFHGTLMWQSPEQMTAPYILNYSNDIWSMCCVFGQMITGNSRPFENVKTYKQLLGAQKAHWFPRIDNAPSEFQTVIEVGRQHDHTQRPPARLIANTLSRLLNRLERNNERNNSENTADCLYPTDAKHVKFDRTP